MKRNMGNADRIVRLLVAGVFAWLYFTGIITGIPGILLLVVGGIFVLTSLFGTCPLYSMLGINSCSVKKEKL